MSAEENKQRTLAFYEKVLNGHNVDLIDEFCAKDCVEHSPPPIPDLKQGVEGVKQMLGGWLQAFPDLKMNVVEVIAEGDRVSAVCEWSGTHKGSLMGERPTGKSVHGRMIDFVRIENGMMTEHWGYGNDPEVLGSLGISPPAA